MIPETRFTELAGRRIAYQVVGSGRDLLFVRPWLSHVDAQWEFPYGAAFFRRLASFSRLILFDKRGMGASDQLPEGSGATWEDWMDDVGAVLNAAGAERAVIVGAIDGGPVAMLFAATYPERTEALVLVNSTARPMWADDYPFGLRPDAVDGLIREVEEKFGNGAMRGLAPSMAGDDAFWRAWDRFQRMASTRSAAVAQLRTTLSSDARSILSTISVPTLILHPKDCALLRVDHARYLADHITSARLAEVPGTDLLIASPQMVSVLDPIEEFVTGVRPAPITDRVLATVLFTDIVGSTEQASRLGDRRWGELMAEHLRTARRELGAARGRLVKDTGDGLVATFDGPARAIRCAASIRDRVSEFGISIRAGLHTGEVEVEADDVRGLAVHIAARVMAEAQPGDIVVSSTVRDLVVGSGIAFQERGSRRLRGVPGRWKLFAALV